MPLLKSSIPAYLSKILIGIALIASFSLGFYSLRYNAPLIFLVIDIAPRLFKTHYLNEAARIIPAYPNIKPTKIDFSPGSFDVATSVDYNYQSNNPYKDYENMRVFYKQQLLNHGWDLQEDVDSTDISIEHSSLETPRRYSIPSEELQQYQSYYTSTGGKVVAEKRETRITFKKHNDSSPHITLAVSEKDANPIGVYINF